jgi:signal transduction histidine kinase/FixJ family two-component response regulator
MFIVLLVTCVLLLGVLVLRLAAEGRRQQHVLSDMDEALKRSREDAEQQRTRLAEQADLDKVKTEFISTVSHELRTPLTSIRGALGLLSSGLMGNMDEKSQNLLRIASTNTERLIRLINDILDLERMESGAAPAVLRRCSLYDLAREAVEEMSGMAEMAKIRLTLHCFAAQEAVYFNADPDRIMQVMTNLLSNAIKFSPTGSTVSVQINADEESAFLKVIDRGRGVPTEKLESIFNRFQQVESTDASKKGGTGLGLAICRSIVLQHGGVIWAQPNQNGGQAAPGTTFCVQLTRCARSSDTVAPTIAPLTEHGEGLILVCDDDSGIRTVVAEQLRQHGYETIETGSGEEVIALAHEQVMRNTPVPPISAIVLDLYLPGLNGMETLRQLKKSSATAEIPVVVLSVIPPSERMLRTGEAQGWVQKPFSENLLLAELGRVLQVGGNVRVSQQPMRDSRLTV